MVYGELGAYPLFQGYYEKRWIKDKVKNVLQDQFLQLWRADVDSSPKSLNYRIFKDDFKFENYLDILDYKNRVCLCRFRTCNHRLPIETGRWYNLERKDRICNLCLENKMGDEFHYILECKLLRNERKSLLGNYYCRRVNTLKMKTLFQSDNISNLKKLCKFIKIINNIVSS